MLNRLQKRGRYFFEGEKKFLIKGVTYGPFYSENIEDNFFGDPIKARNDLHLIRDAGFNLLRIYLLPPDWFMDLAEEYGLRVLIGVPWNSHDYSSLFLESKRTMRDIRQNVSDAAKKYRNSKALFGYLVANEIRTDIVRWYGHVKVEAFLDSLILEAKEQDPQAFASYSNFPLTDFINLKHSDFISYNVYLNDAKPMSSYFKSLLNKDVEKPLMIGEFGLDTQSHGQLKQNELLKDHHKIVYGEGLAGTVLFSFTDEWYNVATKEELTRWDFGLVDRDRKPKLAYESLKQLNHQLEENLYKAYPLEKYPKISVVICSYNGGATLRDCLNSLNQLRYPNYEVVVVDDGSTDNTREIVRDFPQFHTIHKVNEGLSVARNTGIQASIGEIVAFTDSDCMVDQDWLYQLAKTFNERDCVAVGGPNISPRPRNWVQAAVAAAPGGPSHVLFSDHEAEHIPGCNMAFRKSIFDNIGYFDSQFCVAGDDVDICWRILQKGFRIGFNAAATVLHYRRFTVKAFFKQQSGYGKAEALLSNKHSEYFNGQGSIIWAGTVYENPHSHPFYSRPIIYYGVFGTGAYKSLYYQPQYQINYLFRSLNWFLVILLSLAMGVFHWAFVVLGLTMFLLSVNVCARVAFSCPIAAHSDRKKIRSLLLYLYLSQGALRDWSRVLNGRKIKFLKKNKKFFPALSTLISYLFSSGKTKYWSEEYLDRSYFLERIRGTLKTQGMKHLVDNGWKIWDLKVIDNPFWHVRLKTVSEFPGYNRVVIYIENQLVYSWLGRVLGALLLLLSLLGFIYLDVSSFVTVTLLLMALSFFVYSLIYKLKIAKLIEDESKKLNLVRF